MSASPRQGLLLLRPYTARGSQAIAPRGQPAACVWCQSRRSLRSYGTEAAPEAKKSKKKAKKPAAASSSADSEDVTDRSLIARRLEELKTADALEYPRYQTQAGKRVSAPSFRAAYDALVEDGQRIEISGRVLSIRRLSSKLMFCNILDEGKTVQIQFNLAQLVSAADGQQNVDVAEFKQTARLISRGDHIAVTGRATRTSSGEPSLAADALPRLYSPSLAPLPFQLQDADTCVRRRHIDLLVNPSAASTLRLRSRLLRELRGFFEGKRFVEVQTPILADLAGGATARPFRTVHEAAGGESSAQAGAASGAGSRSLSLRIAPELWLKRLVVGGLDRVYEIGPAFRNEGIDLTHNPEFTMCEFYAAYWTLPRLISETERLMGVLARASIEFKQEEHDVVASEASKEEDEVGTKNLTPPKKTSVELCAEGGPFVHLEFVPALEEALDIAFPDLESAAAFDELKEKLAGKVPARVIDGASSEENANTLAKLLDRLAGTLLEGRSFADKDGPLFITHHPAVMSPLAKSFVCPRTGQRVAARAELFVDGRELANMYEEENDAAAQEAKMARAGDGDKEGEESGVDSNYIAALESALPPTGGWGCGVERLVMLFSGQQRIADCLSFGTLRNVVAMKER